jgi:hypothetical protein
MLGLSGERVSNAWMTYPQDGDSSPKGLIIPDYAMGCFPVVKGGDLRAYRLGRGSRPISLLVG